MENKVNFGNVPGWIFGLIISSIGVLNIILVHPVPGLAYIFFSLIFLPPFNSFICSRMGFTIPMAVKIILGIAIMWFTLGISDLADMYGL